MLGACGDQKRGLRCPELELWEVVGHHVDPGNPMQILWSASALNLWGASPAAIRTLSDYERPSLGTITLLLLSYLCCNHCNKIKHKLNNNKKNPGSWFPPPPLPSEPQCLVDIKQSINTWKINQWWLKKCVLYGFQSPTDRERQRKGNDFKHSLDMRWQFQLRHHTVCTCTNPCLWGELWGGAESLPWTRLSCGIYRVATACPSTEASFLLLDFSRARAA